MAHKAFVSSTFEDLKSHRNEVIASLRKAGIHVDPIEDWTAAHEEPKTFSQERMKDCDLCVLLVARRRGHVPQGETLSITQLEYRAAVDMGIDVLVFMLADHALWLRQFDELEKDAEIGRWRAELRGKKGIGFFNHEASSNRNRPGAHTMDRREAGLPTFASVFSLHNVTNQGRGDKEAIPITVKASNEFAKTIVAELKKGVAFVVEGQLAYYKNSDTNRETYSIWAESFTDITPPKSTAVNPPELMSKSTTISIALDEDAYLVFQNASEIVSKAGIRVPTGQLVQTMINAEISRLSDTQLPSTRTGHIQPKTVKETST
jgi:hypothetical protein